MTGREETYIRYLTLGDRVLVKVEENMYKNNNNSIIFHEPAESLSENGKPVFPIRRPVLELFLSPGSHQKPPAYSGALRTGQVDILVLSQII